MFNKCIIQIFFSTVALCFIRKRFFSPHLNFTLIQTEHYYTLHAYLKRNKIVFLQLENYTIPIDENEMMPD